MMVDIRTSIADVKMIDNNTDEIIDVAIIFVDYKLIRVLVLFEQWLSFQIQVSR
jgi:hypothetical protein